MELREGYKQTEVGVIPEDWDAKPIGKACKLVNGRGFKPYEWKSDGLPIIRIQNLNGSGDFNYFQGHYDKKIEVEDGQLLFAWSGSRGTSFGPHIWRGPLGLLNYHTWKIVVDEKEVSSNYFLHALKELTKFIEEKAHGASALVHTQKWEMEGFEFPLPPTKAEQTAIANALSDADAWIQSLTRLITKKRQIKQGAMQTLLNPYKHGRLKAGWVVKKLGDVTDVDPENLSGGVNPYYKFKYISLEDVYRGVLRNYSDQIFETAPSRARRVVRKGDVLIGTVRPNLQSHCLIENNIKDLVCSTGFAVIRCRNNITDSQYIFSLFFAGFVEKQIQTLLIGSNYPAINSADIRTLNIPLPTLNEQARIATILSDMDADIAALESKLTKARHIKQGMMQNLLTGRIRLI